MSGLRPSDTIVALSSGRPPAAIAIVRLSGPDSFAAAEAIAGPLPPPRTAALRRFADPVGNEVIDRGLLLAFPAPDTATGENIVEFHCHGGRAIVDRLLAALVGRPDVRLAEPGEFTRRALANGRIDLTEAEGLADLLAAETEAQRRAALSRADGDLSRQLEQWRDRLLAMSAAAEVAIDYADEEDGGGAPAWRNDATALAVEVRALLAAPRVEPLRDGLRIVFAGPPNAGKSSLVNALAKSERAIVTPIPGTTRDAIEVPLAVEGLPLLLVDTAGLRDSDDEVERIGIARAKGEAERADVTIWLGEGRPPSSDRVLLVRSKCDLEERRGDGLAVSATTGAGLEELLARIVDLCRDLVPSPRQLALTEREATLAKAMASALEDAANGNDDIVSAEELRIARTSLDKISGRLGVEDLLDQLFGRFCLGK